MASLNIIVQSIKVDREAKDGATKPDTVLALRRSDCIDLPGGWSQGSGLILHPVSHARESQKCTIASKRLALWTQVASFLLRQSGGWWDL